MSKVRAGIFVGCDGDERLLVPNSDGTFSIMAQLDDGYEFNEFMGTWEQVMTFIDVPLKKHQTLEGYFSQMGAV